MHNFDIVCVHRLKDAVCLCCTSCVVWQAKETLARQQPPEVRILKHLLTLESESDRRVALEEAFQPGAELSTESQDLLST